MTINKYEWFIEIWTKFKYKSLNLRAGSDCLAYLPPVVIRGTAGCVTHMVSFIISGSSLVLFFPASSSVYFSLRPQKVIGPRQEVLVVLFPSVLGAWGVVEPDGRHFLLTCVKYDPFLMVSYILT